MWLLFFIIFILISYFWNLLFVWNLILIVFFIFFLSKEVPCRHLRSFWWKNKRFFVFLIFNMVQIKIFISDFVKFFFFWYNIIIDNVFRVKIEWDLNIIGWWFLATYIGNILLLNAEVHLFEVNNLIVVSSSIISKRLNLLNKKVYAN
jgi:hypothetical protein